MSGDGRRTNECRESSNGLIPGVTVGHGVSVLTDPSDESKGVSTECSHGSNECHSRDKGRRCVSKGCHTVGQTENTGSHDGFDQIEDFVGDGGGASAVSAAGHFVGRSSYRASYHRMARRRWRHEAFDRRMQTERLSGDADEGKETKERKFCHG